MNTVLNAVQSWKTTLIGLLLVIVGVVQAANEPSLSAAFKDPKIQIPLLAAIAAFLAKDSDKTGVIPPK